MASTRTSSRRRHLQATTSGYGRTEGEAVVELCLIEGMGHGTPVRRTKAQARARGAERFMLDVGLSSSLHLARSWGLVQRKRASGRK